MSEIDEERAAAEAAALNMIQERGNPHSNDLPDMFLRGVAWVKEQLGEQVEAQETFLAEHDENVRLHTLAEDLQARIAELEAEKARTLEDGNEFAIVCHWKEKVQELEAREAVMREALEWYGNEDQYRKGFVADSCGCCSREIDEPIIDEWGKRARQALSSSAPSEMLERVKRLENALTSISKNGCCDTCQEAKLVALAALEGGKG